MERYPTDIPQWMNHLEDILHPGGESLVDIRQRAMPKLKELPSNAIAGRRFVLVCSWGAESALILAEALNLPYAQLLRIEQEYGLPEHH